ncbi:MAG: nickel pincer cofactor biosynthesis protein LarC [Eubacterium sp.]|nr:nickel pincer cofactor biosynthesis protein LarC [Eubacterium sp.]
MKTLYFDCASGISGNMALGALLEITGDEEYLVSELRKLNIDGYSINISKKVKNGITGTYVDVKVDGEDEYGHHHDLEHDHDHEHHGHEHEHHDHEHEHEHCCGGHDHEHDHEHEHDHHNDHDHDHEHEHHHAHRNLDDINRIIDGSELNDKVKDLAKRIFLRVAKAESKVHSRPLSEVHFHEVGATDSIIDIVGTAILVSRIAPERIVSSVVNDGYGFIECAHGTMAVPVPATSEIFADSDVKYRQIDIDTELVTPTGAAIIAELAESFTGSPAMVTEKVGWGAGSKDLKIPDILKVCYGESDPEEGFDDKSPARAADAESPAGEPRQGDVAVMETNIDDCSGEILGYIMEKLFRSGALDVFYSPIYMKKNRPAYRLTAVCLPEDIDKIQDIIFRETTTIGIRYRFDHRTVLRREMSEADTPYGKIAVKKVTRNGETYVYPEFESMKKVAEKSGVPLKDLYRYAGLDKQDD